MTRFNTDSQTAKRDLLAEMTWEDLHLSPALLKAVRMKGFEKPTIIQAKALPAILEGRNNFIGQAKNGSGKTAAFALAALMSVNEEDQRCQVIVISPARELAQQNLEVLRDLGSFTNVRFSLACPPLTTPELGSQIVSGTPGKIEDWLRRKTLEGDAVRLIILDEADTMLENPEEGMSATILKISRKCPQAQRVLFSATFPKRVRQFSLQIAPDCVKTTIKNHELQVRSLCQLWSSVASGDFDVKNEAVAQVMGLLEAGQAIVFCNSIVGAEKLANSLKSNGFSVTLLVGKNTQPAERDARMNEFRTKTTTILVTTDVLARGIDVPAVNLVVNYDMPILYEGGRRTDTAANETYLHRVGRAGRMGRKGFSLSFISSDQELALLMQVAQEYELPIHEIPSDFLELRKLLKSLEAE